MPNSSNSTESHAISHVAIIMDGNGRWAKARGLPRLEGHRKGVENVREILETTCELGIRHLTLFAFSVENWQRPENEIAGLMTLLRVFLKKNTRELLKNDIRLNIIGRSSELPAKVQETLQKACAATAHCRTCTLHLALNYGSRTEVLDAVKAFAQDIAEQKAIPDSLKWDDFAQYLYTRDIPDPDLLIRTSGEARISNFLLLQCAYSELYFTPTQWPEFKREHFIEAIESYKSRERRFGKTGEQLKKQPAIEPAAQ